mmetsp:Transcript_27488/g.88240  ORF Transcript_27488/g.88240 Transcript_27488/m.88240 type:complete len:227 (-) Transcript_27488:567-1247(-)
MRCATSSLRSAACVGRSPLRSTSLLRSPAPLPSPATTRRAPTLARRSRSSLRGQEQWCRRRRGRGATRRLPRRQSTPRRLPSPSTPARRSAAARRPPTGAAPRGAAQRARLARTRCTGPWSRGPRRSRSSCGCCCTRSWPRSPTRAATCRCTTPPPPVSLPRLSWLARSPTSTASSFQTRRGGHRWTWRGWRGTSVSPPSSRACAIATQMTCTPPLPPAPLLRSRS